MFKNEKKNFCNFFCSSVEMDFRLADGFDYSISNGVKWSSNGSIIKL